MKPDEIREGIKSAAARRADADAARREATEDLIHWLRLAQDSSITHAEAARLAGLSRNGAYGLLRRRV